MTVSRKLLYFFPVLLCFTMPFGIRFLPFIISGWLVTSFFALRVAGIRSAMRNANFWLPVVFFLATVLSAVLSENREEAVFAVEVKMSFLVIPFLFFAFDYPIDILKRCVVAFVSGCFFACVFLIVRALIYTADGQPEYFFYTLFSDFMHASYFSMYLMLAIAFVAVLYHQWFRTERAIIYSSYFFLAIFVTTIFLCGSKLGIISLLLLTPLLIVYRWRKPLSLRKLAFVLTGVAMVALAGAWLFPSVFERMATLTTVNGAAPDPTATESTAVRRLIWQQATALSGEHFFTGVGVGDANDALYKAYSEAGMTGALAHRLNAHNQYLQTFLGMGVAGFLLLAFLTIGLVVTGWRKRNFFLAWFGLLITLNFLVESMLQTAAGVIFYTFFFCFLTLADEDKLMLPGGQQ